ncbi:MAG: hypothetical protein AB7I42_24170 [Bradyrhizobium sp.]|uniref:hypothetical protein n=1 Tax=Bradyrhizobium sp. TaxID=376 RepID=UPI003D09DB61
MAMSLEESNQFMRPIARLAKASVAVSGQKVYLSVNGAGIVGSTIPITREEWCKLVIDGEAAFKATTPKCIAMGCPKLATFRDHEGSPLCLDHAIVQLKSGDAIGEVGLKIERIDE